MSKRVSEYSINITFLAEGGQDAKNKTVSITALLIDLLGVTGFKVSAIRIKLGGQI